MAAFRSGRRPFDGGAQLRVFDLTIARRFFAWLVKTGRLANDTAAELELPKIPKRQPPVILSAPEAESVLRQPDLATRQGLRDRANLELLYSTGMRRAEAAALLLVDFDPVRGLVRVRQGKGGNDRYVQIGERAIRWVEKYLVEARPRFVQGRTAERSSLTDGERPSTRAG